ncbi:hypothetical protein [Streptomyces chrestomyceticus]|uniref:Permease n=1 Tax=Streptomyces chrestomyceticus TaxID=68185 RepID=A0ABU7X8X7_9ACTN
MKRIPLFWQMLRIGRAAGKRAGGGRVRAVALLLATAVLALGLTTVAATYAAYDGIEQRTDARRLLFHDAYPTQPVTALAMANFDEIKGRQFSLVYIRPTAEGVALPPGVDHWPAPGEAYLSPELKRLLQAEGTPDKYGKTIGVIREEGLASPGERYAYVNPTDRQLDKTRAYPIVGFGPNGMPTGDVRFIADRSTFLSALYLILVPALALAVLAVCIGSAARDERTSLVRALGGRWRHRTLLNLGESVAPVITGAILGILPALLVQVIGNVRLPWIGYWLSAYDLRQWWWAVLLAGPSAALVMLLLVCLVHRSAGRLKSHTAKLFAGKSRALYWGALACPILIFATVWGPAQFDPLDHAGLRDNLYTGGVIAVMATLPCAIALGVSSFGPKLAFWTRRTGDTGALISGRHAAAHPAVTVRLVAGVSIALVLVGQVQIKNSMYGRYAREAQATVDRVGQSVLLVNLNGHVPRSQVNDVLGRLPSTVEVFAVYRPKDLSPASPARIQGSCRTLRVLRLPCSTQPAITPSRGSDQRLIETLRWASPVVGQVEVQQAPPLPDNSSVTPAKLALISDDGKDLPQEEIKQLLRDEFPVAAVVASTPGSEWLVGAQESLAHGRWVVFFGIPGVLIVAIAVALANLTEFLRFSQKVAPLSVLTGRRKVYYSAAAWTLLLPLLGSVVTSLLAASWLAAPQAGNGVKLSNSALAASAGGLVLLALLTWWWGARAAVRQSREWRP